MPRRVPTRVLPRPRIYRLPRSTGRRRCVRRGILPRVAMVMVRALNPARVGLSSTFGNSAPKTKPLVSRLIREVYEVSRRPGSGVVRDARGPVVGIVETAQTVLTAVEVDALVGDYLAGMSVKSLAEKYGIHRVTVFSHFRRCNVPSRRPRLGLDEKAEAVWLARAGVSMRAITRRTGVDRNMRAAIVGGSVRDRPWMRVSVPNSMAGVLIVELGSA